MKKHSPGHSGVCNFNDLLPRFRSHLSASGAQCSIPDTGTQRLPYPRSRFFAFTHSFDPYAIGD